jgi:hypothetical protein
MNQIAFVITAILIGAGIIVGGGILGNKAACWLGTKINKFGAFFQQDNAVNKALSSRVSAYVLGFSALSIVLYMFYFLGSHVLANFGVK